MSQAPSRAYKLTYFNLKGKGEIIRLIFAVAEVPFEDYRIERGDWPNFKSNFRYGQVPVLELLGTGQVLCQSLAISRFLAKKFNLIGSNDWECAQCDEVADALVDLQSELKRFIHEKDEVRKSAIKNDFLTIHAPKYLRIFETRKKSNPGPWLIGSNYTWIDLYMTTVMETLQERMDPEILKDFPEIRDLMTFVLNLPGIRKFRASGTV